MSTSEGRPGPECWWTQFFVSDHAAFQIALSEQSHDTDAEVDLICTLTGIGTGSRVLDAPCGQGRHAIRLAKAGAIVTGIDASPDMIARADHESRRAGVEVQWLHGDMREVVLDDAAFDAVLCLGGSFGYFGNPDDRQFLTRLEQALKPSGVLLLDAPALELIRAAHRPEHESVVAGNLVKQHRRLDADTGSAQIAVTIQAPSGTVTRTYYQQLYTTAQLHRMLESAGYAVCDTLEASRATGYETNHGHVLILARRAGP